jgi:hypothetical protein
MENGKQPAFGGEILKDSGHAMLDNVKVKLNGLTKREYFAGLAMQGIIASTQKIGLETNEKHIKIISKKSVMYADALLAELKKTKQQEQ